MKKIAIITMCILVVSCVLCACVPDDKDPIYLYVPDGAPALSVAKILHDEGIDKQPINTVVTTGEDVVAKCASGEADMAVLPTNAAVKICSDRDDYKLFSVNVYGVLYIVGTKQIGSIADLQGEKLLSIGLGNTPEYVFKKICDTNNISYGDESGILIEYQTDASTIIPQILQGKAQFALIGEPAVTQLINKAAIQDKTVYNLFDLQQLWQDATSSDVSGYPQASLIVKSDLLDDTFVNSLHSALQANRQFVFDNAATLKEILQRAGSSLEIDYTAELLARCNLTVIKAGEAKSDIAKYLATFTAMTKYLPISNDIYYE